MDYKQYEIELLRKIDAGEKLNESELKTLVYEYGFEEKDGDSGRWTKTVYTVCNLCDRYFIVEWEAGLTEYQENGFYDQPYEVERVEYEKTITVREWREKRKRVRND